MLLKLITLILFISPLDYTENVDWFELNHTYDNKGSLVFDQVIAWEHYDSKPKVVFWYILKKREYREQLTPSEYNKKNKVFQKEWDKLYGVTEYVPKYTPKFIGGPLCPRKSGKKYIVVMYRRGKRLKFHANSYTETWTQYDPESANREIFPETTRRKTGFYR